MPALRVLALLLLVLPSLAVADTGDVAVIKGEPLTFRSDHLEGPLVVLPGVFHPQEAEETVLPLLDAHPEVFRGKAVLEIGAGSGINSLFVAQLGASRVVATDINPAAIETIRQNAESLGLADRVEARLVPTSDMSAFSVIGEMEKFDVIFSNPPYSLDLDAEKNDALTDRGDLGFSIIRGLDTHLEPGGVALLLYASLFYHEVMAKYAEHRGFAVSRQPSPVLTPWESASLFNSYTRRLLEREGVEPEAVQFDWRSERTLRLGVEPPGSGPLDRLTYCATGDRGLDREPLFPGGEAGGHPGWMAIRRPKP